MLVGYARLLLMSRGGIIKHMPTEADSRIVIDRKLREAGWNSRARHDALFASLLDKAFKGEL